MIKLHLFSGFHNTKLGITEDMEIGHLYSVNEDVVELGAAGIRVGMKPWWMQKSNTGILHFDLWRRPLRRAKELYPIVTDMEFAADVLILRGVNTKEEVKRDGISHGHR